MTAAAPATVVLAGEGGPTAGAAEPPPLRGRWRPLALKLVGVAAAIGIWEVVSASGAVGPTALASVPATARHLVSSGSQLASSVAATLEAWAVGVGVAVVAGIALGTLVGRSSVAEDLTEALVRMMRPLPSLALIPIAILLAGIGLKMTAGLVAFTSFWPVFINTRYAVHQVDNRLLDTARTLELRGWRLLARVVLPAASPMIASGIQVAISLALVVTVSVELVAGSGGLGSFVLSAEEASAIPTMYAGIVVGGTLGWVLNVGFGAVARRSLRWHLQSEHAAL